MLDYVDTARWAKVRWVGCLIGQLAAAFYLTCLAITRCSTQAAYRFIHTLGEVNRLRQQNANVVVQ